MGENHARDALGSARVAKSHIRWSRHRLPCLSCARCRGTAELLREWWRVARKRGWIGCLSGRRARFSPRGPLGKLPWRACPSIFCRAGRQTGEMVRTGLYAGGRWIRTVGPPQHYAAGEAVRARVSSARWQPRPASPGLDQHRTARRFEAPHLAARRGGKSSRASETINQQRVCLVVS